MNANQHRVCDAAIAYADLGLLVMALYGIQDGKCSCGDPACTSPGKHPHARFAPHGCHSATTAGDTICDWFTNGDLLNIGIATGPGSGLIVLDIDPRHGGDESVERLGPLLDTATVQTGGGGRHLYFRYPVDLEIRNSAGKLGPGLDIRANGGYVVAPPSRHISGGEYRWLRDPRGGIAELPAGIRAKLTSTTDSVVTAAAPIGEIIPIGQRDNALTSLAGSMRRRGMSEAGILAALRVENESRCEESLPDADLQRIARSIGQKQPAESTRRAGEAATPKIAVCDAATWLVTEPPEPDQILANTFDRGDKIVLIGPPKVRKSFALLQLMESLAAGRDCWGWSVAKARRVVGIQFEIQGHHFHRRVRRMAMALGLTPADLDDRLQIINGRGLGLCGPEGIRRILETVKPLAPDVICLDPLYKLLVGKENAAEDLKVTLNMFDELAEATGAAIVYVHHDAKGFSGDRDIRDRGAGSNVLGRDYDCAITLTPHASEPDAVVVETLLRNYRPQEPFTVNWTEDATTGGYCFVTRSDIAPTKQTSTTARKQNATPFDALQPVALELLAASPLAIADFKHRMKTKCGLTRDRTDEFTRWSLLKAETPLDVYETRGKGKHVKYIGTAEQIAQIRDCSHA